ncbi:MAG: hypothetical protein J6Y82_03750 [Bacteroidales bacterium]|nr:hypothetical protein [Bacteroidales bacterium]
MTKNIITLLMLLCASSLLAQEQPLLDKLDEATGQLLSETNRNKYSYNYPKWASTAKTAISETAETGLKTYVFRHLKHAEIDNTEILYFIKHFSNHQTFNWIAYDNRNKRTFVFEDVINIGETQKVVLEKLSVRDLIGFTLRDETSGATIFTVPDIETRLNFEILVDIKYSDEEKSLAQKKVKVALADFFYTDEAIEQEANGFPRMQVVQNEAKTVRVVTYMTSYADFTSKCHGFVLHKSSKDGQIKCEYLDDCTNDIKSVEYAKLKADKWYGAVYSAIIEIQIGKQLYYTLLGFKSNDGLIKTRVIDILSFKKDKSVFGAPYFLHEKATYLRRIFQYSSEANMLLRYDAAQKQIVMDHLSPSNSMFAGEYRFYGPDFSYDAYEITKDGWTFREDIDYKDIEKKK